MAEVDYQSLLPICSGEKKGHHGIYGAYLNTQRMYRTDKYKMLIYPVANVVRLYDMKNDPNELNDIAGDKQYKEVLDKLFSEFQQLQKELNDPLDLTKYYNAFFKSWWCNLLFLKSKLRQLSGLRRNII